MRNREWKGRFSALLALFVVTGLAFAGGGDEAAAEGPVELPFLMRDAGNDSGTLINKYFVETFNAEFEGDYQIVVEWMPGLAEDIRAKLKVLNSAGDLPAVVTDLGAEPAFGDLLIENGRLMDLKPYFDASPEWQEVAIPESIEYVTDGDTMFTAPTTHAAFIGIYYNKELFAEAGVESWPSTWDEFWAAADKLKAAGITPISLHTTETGWCSMLVATSSMAWSDEGRAFMEQQYPTNYDIPIFKDAMRILRKAYDYTTPDAVGGNYALASNNFLSGKTAMIANGPWMIPSLSDTQFSPEGFEEKVGYGHFPEGVMLSWLGLNYGLAVSMDHELDVREGAVEYIKFLARPVNIRRRGVKMGDIAPKVALTESDLAEMSPAMQEYATAVTSMRQSLIVYQTRWDPITQNEVIPAELPNFVTDRITVDELVMKMSEAGQKYAEESN